MIDNLTQVLMKFLPLSVGRVLWDGDMLTLQGDNWNFSTRSAWRIIKNEKIQFACWDEEIGALLKELNGVSILSISPQGNCIQIDPIFKLSNDKQLEVFSTDTVEPWVLQLPDGKVYVGNR